MTFKCTKWEDDEFIVSVLLDGKEPWEDIPIGPTVREKEGQAVADWLNRGGLDAIRDGLGMLDLLKSCRTLLGMLEDAGAADTNGCDEARKAIIGANTEGVSL